MKKLYSLVSVFGFLVSHNLLFAQGLPTLKAAGGNGSVPIESTALHGSGWLGKVIANFDEPPHMWIEDSAHAITVGAMVGDRAWIDHVTFYLNGNEITVKDEQVNPRTGSRGFCVIPMTGGPGTDGDYTLYARIVPVNGYERLLALPIVLNTNGTISRSEVRYLDFTHGDDSWDGTTPTPTAPHGPWKSFGKAMASATKASGITKVSCAPGTYIEPAASPYSPDTTAERLVEFFPTSGKLGDVIITKPEMGTLQLRGSKVLFNKLQFDLSKISRFDAARSPGTTIVFENCRMLDPNGVTGPETAYYGPATPNDFCAGTDKQDFYALECSMKGTNVNSFKMERNCEKEAGWDLGFFGNSAQNYSFWNTHWNHSGVYYGRQHDLPQLTIKTATFNAPNTVFTFDESPVWEDIGSDATYLMTVKKGQYGDQALTVSQSGGTLTCSGGDSTSKFPPGTKVWVGRVFHSDTFQINEGNQYSQTAIWSDNNFYAQRLKCTDTSPFAKEHGVQPFFIQAGGDPWTNGPGTCSVDTKGVMTVAQPSLTVESIGYRVTKAVDDGTGGIRLSVTSPNTLKAELSDSGLAWKVGDSVLVSNVAGTGGLAENANGTFTISAMTYSTIDLAGSKFVGTYTGGGNVTNKNSGRTLINWAGIVTQEKLAWIAGSLAPPYANFNLGFTSGRLAKQSFPIINQQASTVENGSTTLVQGDACGVHKGDSAVAPMALTPNDFVMLMSGSGGSGTTAKGHYRQVLSVLGANTVQLSAPFTENYDGTGPPIAIAEGTAFHQMKTMQSLGFEGCIWDCPNCQTQMQMGVSNFVMVQCDHIGSDDAPCRWIMRTGVSISGMGMNNVALMDNIIDSMGWDASTPAPGYAVIGFTADNNHYRAGLSFDKGEAPAFGSYDLYKTNYKPAFSFDKNYKPIGGLTKKLKGRTQDGRPLFQWSADGSPINADHKALVGAQQP